MKALCLVTHSRDCENKWRSFESLGHECIEHRYDDRPHDRHKELIDLAKAVKPDVIIYIGAIEQYHSNPVPSVDVLCGLREVAPSIHLCGDASDRPWWPWLEKYDTHQCFSTQVSMDGNLETPIAQFATGLVLLTPTDTRSFQSKSWAERSIKLGLVGGQGHTKRQSLIIELQRRGILAFSDTSVERSYASMAELMCNTKITLNVPFNGTGDRMHVKGRVIEAGLAGSCLLEGVGSPTANWFNTGEHYLEYDNLDRVIQLVNDTPDEQLQTMAKRFSNRVRVLHHPVVFWDRVLAKAGVS